MDMAIVKNIIHLSARYPQVLKSLKVLNVVFSKTPLKGIEVLHLILKSLKYFLLLTRHYLGSNVGEKIFYPTY